MIFRSQNPTSPTVDITINNVYVDYTRIVQIELELSENKHDLVKIVMAGIPPMAITDYVHAPVSLSWFQNAMGNDFKGYVVFVDPEYKNNQGVVNNSPFQLTTLYCFGVSYDMKAKVTKSWEASTLQQIVKELSDKYQYSYSIPEDSYVFPRLVQSEESDWEFLVRICHYLGYSVTMHETMIHIFDRYKSIGRQISMHLLESPASSSDLKVRPGRILSFKGTFGNVTLTSTSNDEVVTSLNSSGKMVTRETVSRDSGFGRELSARFKDQLATNLVSDGSAETMLAARARHKFPYEATIDLTGTAGIRPGGIVDVRKFNSNFDGLWYVSSVCHTITFDKFFSQVTVLRDSTSDDPFKIRYITSLKDYPESVVKDNYWCSKTLFSELYA